MHTLSTLLYTHMYAHTYQATLTCTHVHTNQGCTEPGAEPPTYTLATSSPIPSYTHLHTHTCTHNTLHITTATVFLRPPSAISQSQPPSSWNTCMQYYSTILKHAHTHTHTTATMHTLHTLHSYAHTNQGCTEPGAEPPMYTLATCSPTYTHTHTHKANITTPTILVCHTPPSSRSWSPPISTVREEKQLMSCKKNQALLYTSYIGSAFTHAHTLMHSTISIVCT